MNQIKERKCLICGKPFRYNTEKNRKLRTRRFGELPMRFRNSKTCSKECSRIFCKVNTFLNSRYISQFKMLKEEIKRLRED